MESGGETLFALETGCCGLLGVTVVSVGISVVLVSSTSSNSHVSVVRWVCTIVVEGRSR